VPNELLGKVSANGGYLSLAMQYITSPFTATWYLSSIILHLPAKAPSNAELCTSKLDSLRMKWLGELASDARVFFFSGRVSLHALWSTYTFNFLLFLLAPSLWFPLSFFFAISPSPGPVTHPSSSPFPNPSPSFSSPSPPFFTPFSSPSYYPSTSPYPSPISSFPSP